MVSVNGMAYTEPSAQTATSLAPFVVTVQVAVSYTHLRAHET